MIFPQEKVASKLGELNIHKEELCASDVLNFTAFNPTKLYFGPGVVNEIGNHAAQLGNHALLVYGEGSVHKNGSYTDTVSRLQQHNIKVTEYRGIKSNPLIDDVMAAAALGRKEGVDMVVGIGGGSAIDSAKLIAVCIADNCDGWKVMTKKHQPKSALPILTVLTLAATGTEMNPTAVIQNARTHQKIGLRNDLMYPRYSYLDPTYTLSVPKNYTAYGIVDLVTHCLEAWFGAGDASLADRFATSIIREAIDYGPALMNDMENCELRAKIMWAATNALNSITIYGRTSPDWGVHLLGYPLSALYDIPHGATLSILYPAWMKVLRDRDGVNERIAQLGQEVFGNPAVDETIASFEEFFFSLGCPLTCRDAGMAPSCKEEILNLMNRDQAQGLHHKLSDAEREAIVTCAF